MVTTPVVSAVIQPVAPVATNPVVSMVIEPVASVLPNPVLSVAVDPVATNPVASKATVSAADLSDIPDLFPVPAKETKAA